MTASPPPARTEVVLAVDFGGTKIAVCCADTSGTILAHRRALTVATELASQAAAAGSKVSGIGAVSPGIVLADRVLLAPNVPGWHGLALPALVSRALPGLPVATGNDVQAAALAELRWGQLRGVSNGLYVNVGTGLAAAIVIRGRLVAGANQAAGEIGYATPGTGGHTPALLEEVIGGRSLARRASEAAGRPLTAAGAFADHDPRVVAVVDDAISEFGRHLANFTTLLDPQRIVLGGGLMNAAGRFLPPLRRALSLIVPFPPDLVPGAFVTDAALRGAAALAAGTAIGAPGGYAT